MARSHPRITHLVRTALSFVLTLLTGGLCMAQTNATPTCIVLADGYVSEYAWAKYQEASFPLHHPGHEFFVRGLLQHAQRFDRWLIDWRVVRVDLEQHRDALDITGVDLIILDDVRQSVCDPHEPTLIQFVRDGGGLLVYAGRWGLGGCPKTEYSVPEELSSYEGSALASILPVNILKTPDLEALPKGEEETRRPRLLDEDLAEGIDTGGWQLAALHVCEAREEALASVAGKPLVCEGQWGSGRVVVYTGDDLAWVRSSKSSSVNPFAGALWRRLAARAGGVQPTRAEALPEPPPTWSKPPAFAHPDQPMNFHWGGYNFQRDDYMDLCWARDLVTHSSTLYFGAPESLGQAGVRGWESCGPPLRAKASLEDEATWMVDAQGKAIKGNPCFSNPKALGNMDEQMAQWATGIVEKPWVAYGHMGDETEYPLCYCEHCQAAFTGEFGYGLPPLRDDFSPAYLDKWIDYQMFRNRCAGAMYARAAKAARGANDRLHMFASLPIAGGMCHGDDQLHTQSGFDLLWDHTYPGTMVIRVGLNAQLLEETAELQGRPYVPILDLLQGFDSYDRVPHVPGPEYMREMVWQAIAHGIDSVGWFLYNGFFWSLPGTEAWQEAGRMAHQTLEPMTPTLYQMRNAPQPVGLVYSYSQEAVDGLKEAVWEDDKPYKSVIRWWSHHATQEAYETLKYSHVPFNVVSEYRLMQGRELPWKVLIFPYVEHVHARTRKALRAFMDAGGKVYVGANSTLDLPGVTKLPVSFDTKFTTWWPEDRQEEWNQRRVRQYLIGAFLLKASRLREALAELCEDALISVDDPEVVFNVRQAGEATYVFVINDHQVNPTSPELRKTRQRYNHFMLMPMRFPRAGAEMSIRGPGYLYRLPSSPAEPLALQEGINSLPIELEGGDGAVFLLLPDKITGVELIAAPTRAAEGVSLQARVLTAEGILSGSVPLRIDLSRGGVRQTVYSTTKEGILSWTAPFLRDFPPGAVDVTVTDLASGLRAEDRTG